MQTRYQLIKAAQAATQLERLDRAAAEIRSVARNSGVDVHFFGSYVEGRVNESSDLDVAISDSATKDQRRHLEDAMECIASGYDISIDIVSKSTAEEMGAEFSA